MAQRREHSPPTSVPRVLVLAPRGFSPDTPVFPSPQKPTLLIPIRSDECPQLVLCAEYSD